MAVVVAAGLGAGQAAWAQSADSAAKSVTQLPSVTVTGTAVDDTLQHLQAPVDSGALGSRSQLETPFSSSVVTSADIESRQVNKLGDVFMLDASVSDNSAASGAWASYLTVRGLDLDWQNSFRIDGKPFISYVTTLPYEQFERIDLLKGASGFMYGFGAPGGLVNYVTKKPTNEPVRAVTLGYTSKSLWRESVDLGGRAGNDGRFGYRLNATHEEGATNNDGRLKRDSISLALDAKLMDKLTWDFQSIYQDRKASDTEPTITTSELAGQNLPSPVRNDNGRLVGNGTYSDNAFRFYSTGLKYEISPEWTLSTSYSQSSTKTRRNEEVLYLQDDLGNYDDARSDYGEAYQFNLWQAMAQGRFQTGSLKHDVVIGVSWQEQKNDYSLGNYANGGYPGKLGTGSLWTQNTNSFYSVGTVNSLGLYRGAEITQKAIFASDTVQLTDRWSVLGGLRYTNYDQKAFTAAGAEYSSYKKNGVVTPTVALMYKLAPQTMAYASYVESLEQGTSVGIGYANYGAQLNPLKSRQYEVGVKTENERWAATAALFRIERKAEYANAANELVQDGLSTYQGAELGASARLGSNWNVGGSVMLLDSEYKRGAANIGNRVAGAPKFVAAARISYRVPQLSGLKISADAKYTGSTMLRPTNDIKVGGYTIVDVGATYDTQISGYDTTFRLAVNNVADKKYWMYQYADYIKAGDARSISLNATMRF
ncbi:TonB-dependent siderophore receptor [Eoetvoesiella sp.]|uniref:TonB-dependent siderophore receptor n=1 Tax=Eoetvoesiella sp. TaxID=1966355 RepID=UPI0039C8BD49